LTAWLEGKEAVVKGRTGQGETTGTGMTGRYWARIWDMDCVLELRLDDAGNIVGSFSVDDEPLKLTGEPPSPNHEVRGVIHARHITEPFATFQARTTEGGLLLEVLLNDADNTPSNTERAVFVRLGPD
jgi:hypothetical protein